MIRTVSHNFNMAFTTKIEEAASRANRLVDALASGVINHDESVLLFQLY